MTAKEYGALAYFTGKEKKPTLDENFVKAYLIGVSATEFAHAVVEWLEGWEEETLKAEGV